MAGHDDDDDVGTAPEIMRTCTLFDIVLREFIKDVRPLADCPPGPEVATVAGIVHLNGLGNPAYHRLADLRRELARDVKAAETLPNADDKALVDLKVRAQMVDDGPRHEARQLHHAIVRARTCFRQSRLGLYWVERLPDVEGDYTRWFLCVAVRATDSLPPHIPADLLDAYTEMVWEDDLRIYRFKAFWDATGSLALVARPLAYASAPLSFHRGCVVLLRLFTMRLLGRAVPLFPYLDQTVVDTMLMRSAFLQQQLAARVWDLMFAVTRPQLARLGGQFMRHCADPALHVPLPFALPVADESIDYDIVDRFAIHFNVQLSSLLPDPTLPPPAIHLAIAGGREVRLPVPDRGQAYCRELAEGLSVLFHQAELPPADRYRIYNFRLVVSRRPSPPTTVCVSLARSIDGSIHGYCYNRLRPHHKKGLRMRLQRSCGFGSDPTLCIFDTAGNIDWYSYQASSSSGSDGMGI